MEIMSFPPSWNAKRTMKSARQTNGSLMSGTNLGIVTNSILMIEKSSIYAILSKITTKKIP